MEPKCTFFTVASACIILSGIHAAMVHLPHRVSCPKVTEDDYRKLAIFAKKKVLPGDGSSGSGGVGGSFLGGTEKFTHTQRLRGNTGTGAVQTLSRGVRSLLDIPRTRKLFLYFILNLAFMAVEVGYGFFSNSLGLISDGFHMLFDCFGLFVGLCAAFVSRWEGNSVFTYGYGRVQTLSCLVNCVSLVVISATIFLESLHRFFHKAEMHGSRLLSLSIAGLLVNLVGVFSFHGGCDSDNSDFHQHLTTTSWQCTTKKQKRCYAAASGNNTLHHHHHHNHHQLHGGSDENMRSVFLHILADTLSSIGLIISSYFVQHRGWTIADPVCSLLISTLIFTSVLPLLRLSWCVLLQGTTLSDARIAALEERLSEAAVTAWEADGTREISSGNNTNKRTVTGLCVWDKFPGSTAATVVLHVPEAANEQRVLTAALKVMSDFGISSSCVECVKDN